MAPKSKSKFYVVWVGRIPGIYTSWQECEAQVKEFDGAKFKSYPTELEAKRAYNGSPLTPRMPFKKKGSSTRTSSPILPSISVDAACSGVPGIAEYRGVNTESHELLFASTTFYATNNIAEFLAIVHAMALCKQKGVRLLIYSDSLTAISWIKAGKCRTKLEHTAQSTYAFELVKRAELWLQQNPPETRCPLAKWDTSSWGEIPADYGRK